MQDIYIFKQNKLYAKLESKNYYLFKNNAFVLNNENLCEILDILPEGIDLKIMLKILNLKESLELIPYLKNCIGDFYFSKNINENNFEKPLLSNINLESKFPNILKLKLNINEKALNPSENSTFMQRLSLSGYQHKLQVSITNGVISENYADFILKPASSDFFNLGVNEHLNVSFMREFNFEVPLNAIIYDENFKSFHYIIKRFDIDKNANKLPQISLNALMKSKDKYAGSIEQSSSFLKDRLDEKQKILFLRYIYANALLYNNDLHKKNISFILKENKLFLSPAYDILNIYAIKGLNNLQCVLSIKGKKDKIQISYFEKISELMDLNFDLVKSNLNEIQEIYIREYPKYIEKLSEIENLKGTKELKNKFLESYNKNLKIFKTEKQTKFI